MSRIQIPLDVITSRLNLGDRFQSLRSGPLSGRFSNLRPVGEFLDFKRLSKPANFVEMQSRVNYNLSHYSSNYAVIFVMLSIYALLSNWLLLFDIILVVVGMWFIGKLDGHDLEIGTFRATSSQLYTGLVVVAVPLGLIASPFTTLLWLIGASGVTILGGLSGRPQAPEFAPQWGRPSRRRRRRTDGDAAPRGRRDGDVRVEELSDEDQTDTQGVGISSGTMTRFASDSLRFTGIDMGGGYQDSEDEEDDDSESSEDEEFEQYLAQLALKDREEALVQSARYRIDRARAKGRTDVDLNDEEMAALQRRRERDEAEKKKKKSSKKNRGSRVAIPLTQLEPSSRKKKAPPVSHQPGQLSRPRQSSSNSNLTEDQDRQYPPMGYFPPPATAGRPRSGTASSQRPPSSMRGQRAPSTSRHTSDSGRRGRKPPPYGEIPMPGMSSSRSGSQAPLDPFQFQDPGAQAPSPAGSWRQFSRRQSSQQDGSSEEDSDDSDDDSSEEEREESTSSDAGSGGIVVEQDPSPEPESQPVRRNPPRASTTSSSAKQRKPAKSTRKKK
ncbi:hypothetical protein FSARC_4440 [Fusarium sarcochroum]|uniref:Prenylated Rab acceptor 1 n=1 Tax=Fusarium sarcochroum TaxID=1208366 RepID=A0A8H4XBJ8_9HYPO|nr:hypothetical protein FSARC_4440 [Fusarium sarcochroum]